MLSFPDKTDQKACYEKQDMGSAWPFTTNFRKMSQSRVSEWEALAFRWWFLLRREFLGVAFSQPQQYSSVWLQLNTAPAPCDRIRSSFESQMCQKRASCAGWQPLSVLLPPLEGFQILQQFLKVFLFIAGTSISCLIIISLISIKETWQLQNIWGKSGKRVVCGGGKKQAEMGGRSNLHTAVSPQRTPLGDTFRKGYMTAIWQHGPLALFAAAYKLLRKWDEITSAHVAKGLLHPPPYITVYLVSCSYHEQRNAGTCNSSVHITSYNMGL